MDNPEMMMMMTMMKTMMTNISVLLSTTKFTQRIITVHSTCKVEKRQNTVLFYRSVVRITKIKKLFRHSKSTIC